MADISLIMEVVGEQDVVKAIGTANRMEAEYKKLDKTFNKGRMSSQQYAKGVQQLDAKYESLLATTRQLTAATNQTASAQQVVGKGANRAGVLAQQAGYQFGDFAVQVQSGTNIMVAAGQQATQLVGTFSMLAKTTKGIMAFSALGVLIPVITGIGAAMMRTSGSSDTLLESLDKLQQTNDQLRRFGENFGEDLVGNIDAVRESFGGLVADVYEAQLNQVQGKISSAFSGGIFSDTFARSYTAIKPSELSAVNQAQLNEQAAQEVAIQEELNRITGQTITSKSQLNRLFREAYDNLVASEVVSQQGLDRLQKIATQNGIVLGITKDIADKSEEDTENKSKTGKYLDAHIVAHQKYNDLVAKLTLRQQDQIALLQAELKYGKDSVEVARLRAEQEAISQGLSGEAVENYVNLGEEAYNLDQTLISNAEEAARLKEELEKAASAMSSLSSFGAGIDRAISVAQAQVEALTSGADAGVAGQIAGRRADLDAKLAATLAVEGVDTSEAMAEYSESSQALDTLEGLLNRAAKLRSDSRGGSGGRKSNVVDINEIIAARKEQIAQDRVLLGLKGEEQESARIYYDLLKQNEKADIQLTETELDGHAKFMAAELEKNRMLEETKRQQQELADVIGSSMEDSFMSIVDGTSSVKDAFRDMARDIVAHLFKVLVIQRAIQGIGGAIGGDFGAALQSYGTRASGGTVMANQPYLVGEKGPELIMPQNRGHVMNADLTAKAMGEGSGAVNIVQNFNFSANGDDSVKKLIAEAAPQIANMTQKQIMDSRRRGGSMKATFG